MAEQVSPRSTRDVADALGVEIWRVQLLYENGEIPEPVRFAGRRVIPPSHVPLIVDALRRRGWLNESPASAESGVGSNA